jgi:hypothetical protein
VDDDDLPPADRQDRKPIPLLLWVGIGLGVVFGFLIVLRLFNPPGLG